jgi:molybdopterin-guanine dinucleotide biosynthesis protein A
MTTKRTDGSNLAPGELYLYILAGGQSRRHGSDKARALRDGEPMICGVARVLGPRARSVTVVAAGDGVYDDLGLRTIGDLVPGKGPLGGLITAINDRPGEGWLILAACDWSGIRGEWIPLLEAGIRPGCQAVVFRHTRNEPLLALYHTSVEPTARLMMEENRLAMMALLDRIDTVFLPVPEHWDEARNINRPQINGA